MPEQPQPGESFILGYSADDTAYPMLAVSMDPREQDVLPVFGATTGLSAEHITAFPTCLFTHVQSPTRADTRTLWIYEILPGPWIPDNRDDLLLGPVQRTRRLVHYIAQLATQSAFGKTTYESREGSDKVAWEIVETYSDGTGAPGAATNPAFPQVEGPLTYDEVRGVVHSHSQLERIVFKAVGVAIVAGGTGGTPGAVTLTGTTGTGTKFQATGTINGSGILTVLTAIAVVGAYTVRPTNPLIEPVTGGGLTGATLNVALDAAQDASLTVTSTLATLVEYQKFNEFLIERVTSFWTLPGPAITTSHYDEESGIKITETRTLKQRSSITEANAIVSTSLVVTEILKSGIGAALGIELVTTYPEAAAHDAGTAIVHEDERPYQYPGRINFATNTGGHASITTYGILVSTTVDDPNPSAKLTSHTLKTWWINSTTKPTLTFQEFRPKTVTIQDSDTTKTFSDVLYDGVSLTVGSYTYAIPATVPSWTELLALLGTSVIIDGEIKEVRRFRWKVRTVSVVMH